MVSCTTAQNSSYLCSKHFLYTVARFFPSTFFACFCFIETKCFKHLNEHRLGFVFKVGGFLYVTVATPKQRQK